MRYYIGWGVAMKVGIVSVGGFVPSALESYMRDDISELFLFEHRVLEDAVVLYAIERKTPLTIFPTPYAANEAAFYQAQIIKLSTVCDALFLFTQEDCVWAQWCTAYATQAGLTVMCFKTHGNM